MATEIQIQSLSTFTKGQDWRLTLLHEEQSNLLIWITRGQGLLQLNGSRRGVGTHNAIIVPQGCVFAIELGRQATAQIAVIPSQDNNWGIPAPHHLRLRDVAEISELTGLLETTQREAAQDQPFTDEALFAHQKLIEIWVRRQIANAEQPESKPKANVRLTAQLFENLSLPDMQGATMAQHAAKLGVTPTHLTRASKSATGQTAADHITARILHKAQCALIDGNQTAKTIADNLNFGSAAYFTRFIQQHTGLTPSQLRQRR
jgi:AraC family transcriptional activator of pobA